jgi:branched-chain amino acid transport system permease protein
VRNPATSKDPRTAHVLERHRWHWAELVPWALALAAYFAFPDYMALGTQILIMILFAVSLDLIVGFAGIVTLGHAAFFGAGAYAVAMAYAHGGWTEPLSGLVLGGAVAGSLGLVVGAVLLRYHGLTLLMMTLAVGILLKELANANEEFTGGFDGVSLAPSLLLGYFDNDLPGHNYYWYALVVLGLLFLVARRIVNSPFGRSLVGIRENTRRMHALGTPVHRRLVIVYTISAIMAGVAGALFAQSNSYVTVDVLDFSRSGTVLVILILGGLGRLYGAFVGGAVYMILEDELARLSPEFWEFGVGLVLVLVVLFARDGLLGLLVRTGRRIGKRT